MDCKVWTISRMRTDEIVAEEWTIDGSRLQSIVAKHLDEEVLLACILCFILTTGILLYLSLFPQLKPVSH